MKHLLDWLPQGLRNPGGGPLGGRPRSSAKQAAATTTATATVAVMKSSPGARRQGGRGVPDARQLSFAFDDAQPSSRPQGPEQGPSRLMPPGRAKVTSR